MSKIFSLSLGLALALGLASTTLAGGHGNGMPTPQIAPSPQVVMASPQGYVETAGCGPVKKKCSLFDKFKPKPKCYTYEYVLKKKKVHGSLFGHKDSGCGSCGGAPASTGCNTCGVYPSAQYPTEQSYGSGQIAPTGQYAPTSQYAPAAAPAGQLAPASMTDEAPKAPEVPAATPPTASNGLLFLAPVGN